MKEFQVKTENGKEVIFNFPTTISELKNNTLIDITNHIAIADNYSLIALAYKSKLSNIILMAGNNAKSAKIKVTPIFVKAGKSDIDFIKNAKVGQPIICMDSQLALGVHVSIPNNKLSLDYFTKVIADSANKNVYDNKINKDTQDECIFVEFKIIPNSDIIGFIGDPDPAIDTQTEVNK